MIPPVDLGVQHLRFDVPTATDISNHYLNIVARNSYVSGITLDGNSISSQFTSIDGIVSYAQVAVTPGTHLLESPSGPIVADYYGLGNYAGCAALVGRSFCEQQTGQPTACPEHTTAGRDFWMMLQHTISRRGATETRHHSLSLTISIRSRVQSCHAITLKLSSC